MRLIATITTLVSSLMLSSCMHKGANPVDPYEPINREIYKFNMAFDATMLKPPARLYKAVVPPPVRTGINNAFNNVAMLPTIANDFLQAEWSYTIKDSWRFLINSTLGVGGLMDVADSGFSLPPHYNDFGLTFAKWGNKNSAYIVIPFLGPSTIRDGLGLPLNYVLTPYAYIGSGFAVYSLMGVRYVDLRSQLFDTEKLMNEALDKYSFMRDAYLQHRNYQITGEQQPNEESSGYVDEAAADYIDEEPLASVPKETAPANKAAGSSPQTSTNSSTQDVTHSSTPTRNSTQHG